MTPATRQDAPAIADLLEEMDRFYGETQFESPDVRAAQIEELLFGDAPAAFVLLAKHDNEAIGLATYTFLWPAVGITRSLYLKELYVRQICQRAGIGTLLMRHLADICVQHKCSRMEWTTDRDNSAAQKFYDRLPAPMNRGKIFYRLDAEAIARLAG
ncbi:GNAT family N-acetyltransferase [Micromonospora sp. WMMD1102]|uniref:GNAT family N-acetyltransferase n=1 Tax=Micromonospora sp. WMMD1102 TaxID=3016105 RepID=UPI0024150135|nr:GNAT family N-acetyltransferase [Micromonospora sp. WMMD1102]MDG4790159.1 GNAT family N-acetyltransferase [Micromonospora sp. WMMD1102]